jgi:hypothetical protein
MKLITDKLHQNITNPRKKTQCDAYKIRVRDMFDKSHYLVTSSGKQIWNSLAAAKSALRLMFEREHDCYMYGFEDIESWRSTSYADYPVQDHAEKDRRSAEFIQKLYDSVDFVQLTDATYLESRVAYLTGEVIKQAFKILELEDESRE